MPKSRAGEEMEEIMDLVSTAAVLTVKEQMPEHPEAFRGFQLCFDAFVGVTAIIEEYMKGRMSPETRKTAVGEMTIRLGVLKAAEKSMSLLLNEVLIPVMGEDMLKTLAVDGASIMLKHLEALRKEYDLP